MKRAGAPGLVLLFLAVATSHSLASVTSALSDARKAMDVAAQAVRELTGRVRATGQSKREAYDLAIAQKGRARLGPYAAGAGQPIAKDDLSMSNPVDRYLRLPSLENWTLAKREIQVILMSALNLLKDVKSVRNEFVAEPLYQALLRLVEEEGSIPDQFALLVPPRDSEELEMMKAVREQYWALWNDLALANRALGEYLQRPVAGPTP